MFTPLGERRRVVQCPGIRRHLRFCPRSQRSHCVGVATFQLGPRVTLTPLSAARLLQNAFQPFGRFLRNCAKRSCAGQSKLQRVGQKRWRNARSRYGGWEEGKNPDFICTHPAQRFGPDQSSSLATGPDPSAQTCDWLEAGWRRNPAQDSRRLLCKLGKHGDPALMKSAQEGRARGGGGRTGLGRR